MTKRVLFAGCSFVSDCGFTEKHINKYHWPIILSKHFDFHFLNIGFGGMSNDEIFYRTTEQILQEQFDLVIVMWSSIGRKWIYHSESNVDDFTIINYGKTHGFNCDSFEVNEYAKLHYSYFNNQYMNLKHWLLKISLLEATLKNLNQPFIFIKGFDNYISDIKNIKFTELSDVIKDIIDFHNKSDFHIFEKLSVLQKIFYKIDRTNWLDFEGFSFNECKCDVSDDGGHPGIKSNQLLVEKLIDHIKTRNLL